MNTLATLQDRFQAFVHRGEPAIDPHIVGDDALRQVRLGIYYDAYRLRLVEALGKDFEALAGLLGESAFGELARAFIDSRPSGFRNLRWYGGGMADFLASDARYSGRAHLAELARLEWTMGLAFDAPDEPVLDFAGLAGIAPEDWPSLRFKLHPCVHSIDLRSNAVGIWHAVKDSTSIPDPEMSGTAVTYMIWRKDYASYFRSASADEAWAVRAADEGQTFAEISAGICDWVPEDEAPGKLAGYLRNWVDEGWLSRVD